MFHKLHASQVLSLNETLDLLDEDAVTRAVDLLSGADRRERCYPFFSYSGSTKDMEDIMRIAKDRKVSIILITHFPKSRATEFADVVLLCGYNEGPLQSGSVAAKLGQLFLIECLFYGFCKRNPEVYALARSSTAEAITHKLL